MKYQCIDLPFDGLCLVCLRSVLASTVAVTLSFQQAQGSNVLVPGDFSTVQSAIDSGADTVSIRPGTYPEHPLVDHAIVLQATQLDQRPRLAGLEIVNSDFWANPPLLSVRGIQFSGPVHHTTLQYRPRHLQVSFAECSLDSGLHQLASLDPEDVASLAIRSCRLGGYSHARVARISMDADTVDGSVSWAASDVSITGCWFRGGPGTAIALSNGTLRGTVANNRIDGHDIGISVENIDDMCTLERNVITSCGVGMRLGPGYAVAIMDNDIENSDIGVDVRWLRELSIVGNTVLRAGNCGLFARVDDVILAERNVVGHCGGPGIVVECEYWVHSAVLRKNTVFNNAGAGLEMTRLPGGTSVSVSHNIGFRNLGWGLVVPDGGVVELTCNDWFGNGLGAVSGAPADSGSMNVDPLFCGVDSGDVRLDSASPLLDAAGCGQIGARGAGCGVTATLVRRFTAERVSSGVLVVWQVAEGTTTSGVWLERSDGGAAWKPPLTERAVHNGEVVELDRSAAPDLAYWYRLAALVGGVPTVIGAPIVVGAAAGSVFGLVEVGPNPGTKSLRVSFALKCAAAIELDLFDVQGRKLTSLASGVWPAGTHALEWDGRTHSGKVAPAGLYILRYVYPGGLDRRTIVRIR